MNAQDWLRITALGDSAVLLPCMVVMTLWLAAHPATRRAAGAWLGAMGITIGSVVISKVLYMGWAIHPPGLDFTGLSGHAALSFLVWPVLLALLAGRLVWPLRWFMVVLGYGLALAITISRVVLSAHTVSEAVLGAVLGAGFSLVFLWFFIVRLRPPLRGVWVALSLMVPLLMGYGHRFPSNHLLEAFTVKLTGHVGIYARHERLVREPWVDRK